MVNDKPSYLIVNKMVMVIIAAKSVNLRAFKFGWFYRSTGFIEMPQYEVHGKYPHKGKST